MEFENRDDLETRYEKNRTCKCEDCGYVWVEKITTEENSLFDTQEEREYFCPMCGGSYLDQM
ncbi:MAG: hypothetical protein AB1567_10855 [bacterium]